MRPFLLTLLAACLLAACLLGTASPAMAVPAALQVQGALESQAGVPVNGTYSLTFRVFAAETGGAALWSQAVPGVVVEGGLFDVTLTGVPGPVFDGSARWLETQVDAEPPLPRRPVLSSAYALRAGAADSAATALDVACSGCVQSAEVAFQWALGATKGGAAADLDCPGCVGPSDLAAGVVTSSKIQDGSIAHSDLAFSYAASATPGGPAADLACSGCVAGGEIAANVVLTGNAAVTGSLHACVSGAPGCGVKVADKGGLFDLADGFVTLEAPGGLRVRSLTGTGWRALEAGDVTAQGRLSVATTAATQEVNVGTLDGGNADVRYHLSSGHVDWYGRPSSPTDQSILSAWAYPTGKPDAQVLALRWDGTAIAPGRALVGFGDATAAPGAGDLGVSGSVGVGISSPLAKLHVNQAGSGWADGLMVSLGPERNRSVMFQETESGNKGQLRFRNYQDQGGLMGGYEFTDHTGAPKVRILDSGRTGIGTTEPQEILHVAGNLRVDGSIIAGSAGEGVRLPATPEAAMTCDGAHGGTIYWSAEDKMFYGCDGTDLVPFGGSGAGADGAVVFSCTPSDWSQAYSGGTWSPICTRSVTLPQDSVVLMAVSGHITVDTGWCYLTARIGGQDWNPGWYGATHTYLNTWHPVGYSVAGEITAGTHTVQFGGIASNTCSVNGTVLHGIAIPKKWAKSFTCQQPSWGMNPAAGAYTSICNTTVDVPQASTVWMGLSGHWNTPWCYLQSRIDNADWYTVSGYDPWGAPHSYYTNWHPIGGALTGNVAPGTHSVGYGTKHNNYCYVNGAKQSGVATWAPDSGSFSVRQGNWSHSGAGTSWTTIATETITLPKDSAVYIGVSGHTTVSSGWCYVTAMVDGQPASPTGASPTWKWGASHTYLTNWHSIGYSTTLTLPAGSHTIGYAVMTGGSTCYVNGTRLYGFYVPAAN